MICLSYDIGYWGIFGELKNQQGKGRNSYVKWSVIFYFYFLIYIFLMIDIGSNFCLGNKC